ncbi:MAG: LysM peptidoglycan-binding domain-containing protein [Nostocales cyanobacterium]|nr:MAG: LysM peptidoglycan-binding domain-containing protein [Nostocales cyanobacterium]TAF15085.1 MAG: LysM peptidoglycan-binding domain-containing protein [Nostocales cyanobacterium]
MSIKIDCPVCGYKEIEGKNCPNCETDLSLIRSLQELPTVEKIVPKKIYNNWTLALGVLILLLGIGLGALSSLILIKNQYTANMINSNPTVVVNQESLTQSQNENKNPDHIYTVQSGDNLGLIAEKVCGKASAWKLIAEANPNLESRNNYFIQVGDKLKIPNCREQIQ